MKKTRLGIIWTLIILTAALFSACTSSPTPAPPPEVPVDSLFKEFYHSLGGRETLGPAIIPAFLYNNKTCQYTSNTLMCYDPLAADPTSRYHLLPLGISLNIKDAPDAPTGSDTQLVVEGYTIYPSFVSIYNRLRGIEFAGRPLTRPRYNYLQRRIEQYFENVGFYQSLDDPNGQVCLLAYGMYGCQESCQQQVIDPCLGIINPSQQQVEQPFLTGLVTNKLIVIGQPVSQVFYGTDGLLQQVYEAAIVYSPSGNGSDIRLRPISTLLNLPVDEAQAPTGTSTSQFIFYPTQGELGFYVLMDFDKFINQHGGLAFSGMPIAGVEKLERGKYRQCFENYCLEFDPAASDNIRVRLTPLGIQYLQSQPIDPSLVTAPLYSPETIGVDANAERATIPSDAVQTLHLLVTDLQKNKPIAGVTASARVILPDGTELNLDFPATGMNGRADISINPLPNMDNGGIIPYHICLNLSSPQPICVSKTYMVWNYR